MKTLISIILILTIFQLQLKAQIMIGQTEVDTTTIIYGLDIPWEIQYGSDDHLWITERFGRVSRIDPITGQQYVILDISSTVYQSGESGLLGMVLHPDFETSPLVYLAYTYYSGGVLERIVSYEYNGTVLSNEIILLDNIPGNTTHNGCRMIITPDYKLFVTTGDAQNQAAPQDINILNGKVLRLNLDGSIPADNPWPGNPVWSFGHRNAQGLFLGPNGILYSSEHGPYNDDEFNIIEEARNYGWPNVEGFCDTPVEIDFCIANNVVEPLAAWTPTIATSDIVYYNQSAIPEWTDHILLTTLKNKRLYVLELDETGTMVMGEVQYFNDWWGRLRDVCMGPNGEIYLATNGASWSNTQPFTHSIVKVWAQGIRLNLNAFLEGPFYGATLEMKTGINTILPLDQPFGPVLPYHGNPMPDWYYTGDEHVESIPSLDIVDWVLIELRDSPDIASANAGTVIAQQAAFITKTGQIVGLDGISLPGFQVTIANNLFVAIWSRNHIGVISANPLSEIAGEYSYDFSIDSGQAYGVDSQKELSPGIWGLISGDGNGDGTATINDKSNLWDLQSGYPGYLGSDYNLDGQSENRDKNDFWQPNLGSGSGIPE